MQENKQTSVTQKSRQYDRLGRLGACLMYGGLIALLVTLLVIGTAIAIRIFT